MGRSLTSDDPSIAALPKGETPRAFLPVSLWNQAGVVDCRPIGGEVMVERGGVAETVPVSD